MSEVIIPDKYRKIGQCSICHHPDVDNIDRELIKGTTFSELSRRYNRDHRAFSRHYRKHLMPVIEETIGIQSLVYGDNLIKEIERYRKKTEELLQKAEDAYLHPFRIRSYQSLNAYSSPVGQSVWDLIETCDKNNRNVRYVWTVLKCDECGGIVRLDERMFPVCEKCGLVCNK